MSTVCTIHIALCVWNNRKWGPLYEYHQRLCSCGGMCILSGSNQRIVDSMSQSDCERTVETASHYTRYTQVHCILCRACGKNFYIVGLSWQHVIMGSASSLCRWFMYSQASLVHLCTAAWLCKVLILCHSHLQVSELLHHQTSQAGYPHCVSVCLPECAWTVPCLELCQKQLELHQWNVESLHFITDSVHVVSLIPKLFCAATAHKSS